MRPERSSGQEKTRRICELLYQKTFFVYNKLVSNENRKVIRIMFDKLDFITEKYQELSEKVADPAVISDRQVL